MGPKPKIAPTKKKAAPAKQTRQRKTDVLVVVSKVKKLAHASDLRASNEFIEKLSKLIEEVVALSGDAAKAAGMSTIKERHFTALAEEPAAEEEEQDDDDAAEEQGDDEE
jgi:GTPase Era involved in 16S rRNA processing